MIRTKVDAGGGRVVHVAFVLPAPPDGETISVVGDFNGWSPTETPLHVAGGACTATVTLPAGERYAFRYRRHNGEFFNDDAADDYQPNAFGGYDCVIDLTDDRA